MVNNSESYTTNSHYYFKQKPFVHLYLDNIIKQAVSLEIDPDFSYGIIFEPASIELNYCYPNKEVLATITSKIQDGLTNLLNTKYATVQFPEYIFTKKILESLLNDISKAKIIDNNINIICKFEE